MEPEHNRQKDVEFLAYACGSVARFTYLLRQMIRADVEGCGGFVSLGFEVDDEDGTDAVLWVAVELSELSPTAGALFFFFAIAKYMLLRMCEQRDRRGLSIGESRLFCVGSLPILGAGTSKLRSFTKNSRLTTRPKIVN